MTLLSKQLLYSYTPDELDIIERYVYPYKDESLEGSLELGLDPKTYHNIAIYVNDLYRTMYSDDNI